MLTITIESKGHTPYQGGRVVKSARDAEILLARTEESKRESRRE